jgi:hypothetical protein
MLLWVSRWYRPAEKITAAQIAESTIDLLGLRAGRDGARKVASRRSASR